MKEYIGEDGIPVVEYELEDIPKLKSGELDFCEGLTTTGQKSKGGGSTLFKLSIEAQAFCDAEKEDEKLTYWEKVDSRLEAAIKSFQEVLKRSPAPPETIANRIRQAKWTLNPDNDPNAPFELGIKPNAHLKEAWQNLTKGIIVYSIHNYHNNQLKAHVENLFLQWLKTLQATPETVTDTPTPPQDKEGSTGAESEPKPKAIIFTDPNTIAAIHEGLKAFFPERENDLLQLLKGGAVDNPLHFADQQNKLAEVFSRAYYNGKLGGNKTEVQNWIAANFTYQNKRTKEKTHFSLDTLRGIFNPTGKGEAKKGKRITIAGLEYIAPESRYGYAAK
jgi:hypothetical protein